MTPYCVMGVLQAEEVGRLPLFGGTALAGLRPEPASGLGHSATIDYRGVGQ